MVVWLRPLPHFWLIDDHPRPRRTLPTEHLLHLAADLVEDRPAACSRLLVDVRRVHALSIASKSEDGSPVSRTPVQLATLLDMSQTAGLILANRAYLDHNVPPGGGPAPAAGTGGLLVAVSPVIDRHGSTTWIGAGRGRFDREWTDDSGRESLPLPGGGHLLHRRLYIDDDAWEGHYARAANAFLWPTMHLVRLPLPALTSYFPRPQTPPELDWGHFSAVNAAFADAALAESNARSCWVHDYQLALVPAMLRHRGFGQPIGFFLHTPFPSLEVLTPFLDLRGRDLFREWVAGILGADLAGFQTEADVRRFRQTAVSLGLAIPDGEILRVDNRPVRIRAFPVGIDFEQTVADASLAVMPGALVGAEFSRPLIVGLERADYTKGIPERLRALAALYREGKRFSYVGIASPTREGVAAYDLLRHEIDAAAAECTALAPPDVLFLNTAEALHLTEVMGLLHAADIVCTSSLSDGMNLVPLQAVASHAGRPADERAVVLTGRDAGVASAFAGYETDGLVPLDPLDPANIAAVLRDAIDGRLAPISDRLVQAVRDADATGWGQRFLDALEEAHALR